jgi:hypothetical protein
MKRGEQGAKPEWHKQQRKNKNELGRRKEEGGRRPLQARLRTEDRKMRPTG